MKKLLVLLFFLAFLGQSTCATMENADCFKYYEYQTGAIFKDLSTDKTQYSPGGEVTVSYNLLAQMKAPIAQGTIRASLFYADPSDGDQLIEEYVMEKDVNLMKADSYKDRFKLKLPSGAKPGTYRIKTYFVVGQSFNLAGLSIMPYGAPAELTSFSVLQGPQTSSIHYSKADTYVNGEKYDFEAPTKIFLNDTIEVKTSLVNEGKSKTATVTIKTYDWDDLSGKELTGYAMEKTVTLPENGAADISYKLTSLTPGVYQIRLSAESGDEKSIMKIRVPVSGPEGRLIYLGVDRFPIKKGEQTTVFVCYSTSTDYSTVFNGSVGVELVDGQGNKLASEDSGLMAISPTPPQGKTFTFTPAEDVNIVTVKGSLYDANNNLQDHEEITYDYSKYNNVKAQLTVKPEKQEVKAGGEVAYTVSYSDDKDTPLTGKLLVYITDKDDKIVQTVKDVVLSGQYTGKYVAGDKEGTYTITARELTHDKLATASFTVQKTIQETTTTAAEPPTTQETTQTTAPATVQDRGYQGLSIIAGVVLLLAAALLLILQRRSKK